MFGEVLTHGLRQLPGALDRVAASLSLIVRAGCADGPLRSCQCFKDITRTGKEEDLRAHGVA